MREARLWGPHVPNSREILRDYILHQPPQGHIITMQFPRVALGRRLLQQRLANYRREATLCAAGGEPSAANDRIQYLEAQLRDLDSMPAGRDAPIKKASRRGTRSGASAPQRP